MTLTVRVEETVDEDLAGCRIGDVDTVTGAVDCDASISRTPF